MWRERMEAFSQAIEQQKEDTLDITSDMMRQYKGMQEQAIKKVSELEAENRQLKKTVEEKDAEIAKLQAEKEQQKRASDLEVSCGRVRVTLTTHGLQIVSTSIFAHTVLADVVDCLVNLYDRAPQKLNVLSAANPWDS